MNYKLQNFQDFAKIANLCQGRQNANILRLILPLFMTLIFQTNSQAQTISPIPLTTSSFNFDCVAEASPPSQYTTGSMPGGDVIYSSTYPGVGTTGMPASNTITDGTITYNLEPYTGNNALQLTNITGSTGDLTFQAPTAMTELHLAASSVYGTTNVDVVVTFSDNTTEQVGTSFTLSDWFNGSSVVHTLNGRTTYGGTVYNLNSGNPRIYTYTFNISPSNHSKLITKVTVTRTGGPSTSKPYFFGVAGTFPFSANAISNDVSCPSSSDGSVFITNSNGTAPYSDGTNTYQTDTFTISGLSAGAYSYVFTDANNGVDTVTFSISTVPDVTSPTLATQNVTAYLDASGAVNITPADIDNGTTDNCDTNPTLSLTTSTFDCSDIGTNNVFFKAVDASGNTDSVAVTVTIMDSLAPTVIGQDFTLVMTGGSGTLTVSDIDNGSSDNCGIDSTFLSQTAFDGNHLGTNTVTLTVTDVNGNTSSVDVIVTAEFPVNTNQIQDELKEVKIFPNPTKGLVDIQFNSVIPSDANIAVFDSRGQLIRQYITNENQSQVNLTDYPVGIYLIRVNVNESTKTFRVIKH